MATPKLTFQDILNQRRSTDFVGRQTELDFFRKNLSLGLNDPERKFIIYISGQGGIGKTTLTKRFRNMATEKGLLTAMVDESQEEVPEVLGVFAEQFANSGHELEKLAKRYHDYREKKGEVEADPEAPLGFAGFLGRTIAVGGVKVLRRTPIVGGAAELIDESALGKHQYEKSGKGLKDALGLLIAYLATGQTQEAYSVYERAIKTNKDEESLKEAIEILEVLYSIFPEEKEFEMAMAMLKEALSSS